MNLDVSSFEKALAQLEEAVEYQNSAIVKTDPKLGLHLRAAAIQAFEFSYELAVKMLKRYLEENDVSPEIDTLTFNELVRKGYEIGLLNGEISVWKKFRADRGTTSHTYDTGKAQYVFESIPLFLEEAYYLLAQIKTRQSKGI